ncbi:MAG: tetratricopeptide repeat protein [Phycisphaerales bacterium]|nr:tetratricopeptide repeat protein [Phycisphaerales bacterium]
MHRTNRSNHLARGLLVASMLISPTLLLSTAGGCKAIRERRAQRAAEREQEQRASQLPNQNEQMSESQQDWMSRQPIANQGSGSDSGGAANPRVTETDSGMRIVDERSNPVDAPEPEISVEEVNRAAPRGMSRDQASYEQGVRLHAAGDLQAALRELERAIAFNPQFTLAYLESGDILMEMAQYEQAERQFAMAVRNEPRNYMAQYRHAQVLHKLGALEESNRAYLRALSIRPSSFDANLGISTVLLEMGRAEQALPYGQRAVRSEPPSGRARMHLGNVYAALDRHEEAVIEYQQAAEMMDAPTPGLLLNMAESLNQLQRYAEMVGALDQLVRLEPTAIAYERLGSGLFRLKRYEDALAAFGESSELDPSHYPAFNGIAVCELNQYLWSSKTDGGARERAVAAMRQSLRIDTKQPRIVELLRRYKDPSGREQ